MFSQTPFREFRLKNVCLKKGRISSLLLQIDK